MRKTLPALAGAIALTAASAANATVVLGSTGTLAGSSTAVTSLVTDNLNIPNKVQFDTTNAAAGTNTSFFDFLETYNSLGVFSVTTATNPASSVTLVNVLTGAPIFGTLVANNTGSGFSLNLTTNLAANTWYRFAYTSNMATAGNISGTANFYAAVPEPATWGLMLLGFAGIGMAMRRRRRPILAQVA